MITSQDTANLLKAMIQAAPEIQSISKSKQAYGYKYATLDSLIDMLRGVLPKHGLWFVQMPTRDGDKSSLTTRVIHESGEWMEDTIDMTDTELSGKANDTQKLGASITYFRRYALSAIFGVSADEDVDGNLNNAQKPSPKQATAPTKANPADAALQYISKDYHNRQNAGEAVESILKDYANLLKTDAVRKVSEMQSAERVALATALSNRAKQGTSNKE